MDKIVIRGGERLIGEVEVSGSKNATLPIFVSSLLSEGDNLFQNVPDLRDVQTIIKVLNNLGVYLRSMEPLLSGIKLPKVDLAVISGIDVTSKERQGGGPSAPC